MTIIGGIVGAVIGSAIGGPAGARLGWSIGTTVGGIVEGLTQPGVTVEVGKLSDLRYSGSNYGGTFPRLWGKNEIAGEFIWCANYINNKTLVATGTADSVHYLSRKETKSAGGGGSGGGGSKTVTYKYTASFAVAFGEGTLMMLDGSFVHRFPVFKKIWANDTLIYDADNADNNVTTIRFYTGTESQTVDTMIASAEGAGNASANRGVIYAVIEKLDITAFGTLPNIRAEIHTASVDVGDIASDIVGQVGLIGSDIDFSAADTAVDGFVIPSRSTAQDQLNSFLNLFATDEIEVDGQVKLIKRGGASVVSIPESDLGAVVENGRFSTLIKRVNAVRRELPGRIDLTYNDINKRYEQTTQTDIKQTADFNNSLSVNTNVSTTSTVARQIASRILETAYFEAASFQFNLPWKYEWLAPADPVTVVDNGVSHRVRILSIEKANPGVLTVKCTLDSTSTSSQGTVVGDSGSGGSGTVDNTEPVPTTFKAWSGPELRLEDQYFAGFYVAGTGPVNWRGGSVFYSPDAGTTWVYGGDILERTAFGAADSALADGSGNNTWDNTNSFDITITNDGVTELENTTEANVLNGQNVAVLGNEILGFKTRVLNSPYDYTLSGLRRGMRDTVYTGHAIGDKFIYASSAIVRVNVSESYVGQNIQVKVVSPGETLADVTAQTITIVARTLTPTEQDLAAHKLLIASPTVLGHIKVGTGLSIDGSGVLSVSGGGGGSLTVKEVDGTPNVANVSEIIVTNGKLTDNGSGSITLDLSGSGGGGIAIGDPIGGSPASASLLHVDSSLDLEDTSEANGRVAYGNAPFGLLFEDVTVGNTGPGLRQFKFRGTGAVQANDVLGSLQFFGGTGSSNSYQGWQIDAVADATWSGSVSTADLIFKAGNVSGPSLLERIRIKSDGKLLVGHTSPTGSSLLQVNGGIRIGTNADAAASAGTGAIRYNSGALEFSDGSTWKGTNGINVKEVDGAPDVSNVKILRVPNGQLTDDGSGQVTLANRKKTCVIPLVQDETPSATGARGIWIVPRLNAGATTWNVKRVLIRSEVSNGNTTTIQVERSTGTGTFSGSNVLSASLSLTSAFENSTTSFTITQLSGGDKVRATFSALGASQGPFYIELELEEA